MTDNYNLSYNLSIEQKFVGYSTSADELFIYWFDGDIVHCLGARGMYQVCFIDEVGLNFIELGEL